MESIDTQAIIEATLPALIEMHEKEGMSERVKCAIKAVGNGYAFPTNLDRRPPAPGGMAPESEQEMLRRGLREEWRMEEMVKQAKQIREDSLA